MCNLAAVCATITFHIKLGRLFFLINIMGVMICISVLLSSLFLFLSGFYFSYWYLFSQKNLISHCFRLFLSLRGLCKIRKCLFLKYT